MYSYVAYGMSVASEPQLAELSEAFSPAAPPSQPDVKVYFAPVDRTAPNGSAPGSTIWATPRSAFLEYPGVAAFNVRDGNEIVIEPVPGADERVIRLFLLGPVLALLLHQRGFLVLHASAVNIGGGAVAFVGEKGAGKSTMAAALLARGHALVADDLVAVDTGRESLTVFPGFPQLKLFPESAALLDADPSQLPRVHPEFEKRARRAQRQFSTHALPLKCVVVLCDSDHEAIERPAGNERFIELVRHSYLLGILKQTDSFPAHFQQATALARRVPVIRLRRRRSLDLLGELARQVEAEIERAD